MGRCVLRDLKACNLERAAAMLDTAWVRPTLGRLGQYLRKLCTLQYGGAGWLRGGQGQIKAWPLC